ncbi:apolipoprotein N-acyltransferase [Brucellaceae bacterium D45D]
MIEKIAGRITSLSGWRRALVAFLSGAFASLAQAPYDFLLAGFISFPVLIWLIDGVRISPDAGAIRRLFPAALVGWWFGFGYFVCGLWWIGTALLVDAEQFAWAVPLAVLGLPAFLSIFYAFATLIARGLWSGGIGRIFALSFGFALAEWLRSFLLTGFPWNAIGYAAMPTPLLMQSVAVVGLFGMSALAVVVFASPALLAGGRFARCGLALAAMIAVAHVGFGAWILSRAPAAGEQKGGLTIRIVQPSIAQALKWDDGERRSIFDKLIELTARPSVEDKPRPDVIVWPETAVPYLLSSTPQALARIGETLQPGQLLLTGAVREQMSADGSAPRYYNSILSINDEGRIIGAADKVHLVPFGEYLPFESFLRGLGLQEVVEMPGGFTAAPSRHPVAVMNNIHFLPLICYEAIFPDELGFSGPKVDAILNVTNDAWYGDTPGPYQHFRQAQLRAVEQGLPLIRAANNGISAVTDAYGRITNHLSLNEIGVIDADLSPARAPFWGKAPGLIQTVIALLTLLAASVAFRLSFHRRFD